jgi:hypothetical protein
METRAQGKRRWKAILVLGVGLLALMAGQAIQVSEGADQPAPKPKAKVGTASKRFGPAIRPKVARAPAQLDWDWKPITFDNGVPVGGWMHLTLRQDGSYTFSGHFHDSGFTSYDMLLAFVVKDAKNRAFTITHRGHVSGTSGFGSRDHDWTVKGKDPNIARNWADLTAGKGFGLARTDLDVPVLSIALSTMIGAIVAVITIAGPALVLAL